MFGHLEERVSVLKSFHSFVPMMSLDLEESEMPLLLRAEGTSAKDALFQQADKRSCAGHLSCQKERPGRAQAALVSHARLPVTILLPPASP
jgi:hypothetical protein